MPKSKLYTRTGDKGLTSLVGGERVPKISPRLEAYGTLDEFSAFLGFLAALPSCGEKIITQLHEIQNLLFNIGAYLATVPGDDFEKVNGLDEGNLQKLEIWIDELDSEVPPLKNFILPGGSEAAARAGIARTVCRRAERKILKLGAVEPVSHLVTAFVNRLSDYLFVVGRYLNQKEGVEEIIWKK